MKKIKIEDKVLCNPQTIEHIQHLLNIEENEIIVDFINHTPHMSIIGCLIDMKSNGKDITVLYREGLIKPFLQFFNSIEIK